MKLTSLYLFVLIVLLSCGFNNSKSVNNLKPIRKQTTQQTDEGKTIIERFTAPQDFTIKKYHKNSFQTYLQKLPLLNGNEKVHLYNGSLKYDQNVHAAIVNMDVGNKDLQQCADAVMRLRAEYLFQNQQYDKIHFNFTNGFKCSYDKWRNGYRTAVNGNNVNWVKKAKNDNTYSTFKQYLTTVFMYAGTLSLSKEMQSININDIEVGDVLIQGGSPGHAIIVVNIAENSKGEKLAMFAQSYMPAQQIHILKNWEDPQISPWYKIEDGKPIYTPEWNFTSDDLKRFK